MKIIAIILGLAIFGFVAYKLIVKKKPAKSHTPRKGGYTPSGNTDDYYKNRTGGGSHYSGTRN